MDENNFILKPINWKSYKENKIINSPSTSINKIINQQKIENLIQKFIPKTNHIFYYHSSVHEITAKHLTKEFTQTLKQLGQIINGSKVKNIIHEINIKSSNHFIFTTINLKNLDYNEKYLINKLARKNKIEFLEDEKNNYIIKVKLLNRSQIKSNIKENNFWI